LKIESNATKYDPLAA
jgi:hypothetical protein